MFMKNIAKLKNPGPKSEQWLNAIGIHSLNDLEVMGAIDCCKVLKAQGYPSSLNLAYAIEGALRDVHWSRIPSDVKQALKDALKADEKS